MMSYYPQFASGEESSKTEKKTLARSRVRQRVDAGEPRNSYSALTGLSVYARYGCAVANSFNSFHFNHHPYPHYPFPPATMLNELFARQMVKSADRAEDTMLSAEHMNTASVIRRGSGESPTQHPQMDKAQLLRDILQIRTPQDINGEADIHDLSTKPRGDSDSDIKTNGYLKDDSPRLDHSPAKSDNQDEEERLNCEDGVLSGSEVSEDPPVPADVKKARVETIVNTMRSSPNPLQQVNGCKKRKLYQPMQNAPSPSSPTSADEDESGPEGKVRKVEKEVLRSQLRSMQDQLVAMRNRYEQLTEADGELNAAIPHHEIKSRSNPLLPPPHNMRPPISQHLPKPPNFHGFNNNSDIIDPGHFLDMARKVLTDQEGKNTKEGKEINDKFLYRSQSPNQKYEGLADILKTEITGAVAILIDSILSRYIQQKKLQNKQAELNAEREKESLYNSNQMERSKSPRQKSMENAPRINPLSMHPYNHSADPVPPHYRPPMSIPSMYPFSKPPSLYSLSNLANNPLNPSVYGYGERENLPEQSEALSLVVTPKKKRHKVTDTRITPRTVSRLLGDEGVKGPPTTSSSNSDSPSPHPYQTTPHPPPPPPLLPASLPTSVAIPNPSLHQSEVFSTYSYFPHLRASAGSPQDVRREMDSPPPHHPPSLLHPALLAAQSSSPVAPFHYMKAELSDVSADSPSDLGYDGLHHMSSTLTPMHLRKAKLMFFWSRYPSSSLLKTFFTDIRFNKNNTAQLVKWFSNFREFFYIQMEKYARQAISEGIKSADEINVGQDTELFRVLNLHYNRNNHIEVPSNFRFVIEQTLKEFYKAIVESRDQEPSWKKSIYKIIARLDDNVPEYFKSPSFLEQLE